MSKSTVSMAAAKAAGLRSADVPSQTGRAFFLVREMLLRGDFGRGERISELPLVARLGMSRTPIRLALERLAHIGLLEATASGGFSVREFTLDEVRDAIEVRCVLGGTATRSAASRAARSSTSPDNGTENSQGFLYADPWIFSPGSNKNPRKSLTLRSLALILRSSCMQA